MAEGVIYIIKNTVNSKVYIGQTVTVLKERITKHFSDARLGKVKTYFYYAINKHGEDKFYYEVIEKCPNKQVLNKREIYWIKFYNSTNPENGYNILPGGNSRDGFIVPLETRLKVGNSQKGKIISKETRLKLSIAMKGKKHTEEWKEKMSIRNSGENNPFFGQKHSKKTRKIMKTKRIANKIVPWNKGLKLEEGSAFLGKEHTEKAKKKNRLAHLGRPVRIPDNIREEIRREFDKGIYSFRDLAKMFKYDRKTIANIINERAKDDTKKA